MSVPAHFALPGGNVGALRGCTHVIVTGRTAFILIPRRVATSANTLPGANFDGQGQLGKHAEIARRRISLQHVGDRISHPGTLVLRALPNTNHPGCWI
jgi:hypothetical protein